MEKSIEQDVFLEIISLADKKDAKSMFTDKGDSIEEFNSPINKDKISDSVSDLYTSGEFSDVTLVVGNRSFKAHRIVLSAHSSYFKGMFSCGMKESKEDEIELSNINPDMFELVFKFIYTGKVDMTATNIQDLFQLSNMLQVDDLIGGCAGYVWKNLDEVNCFEVMNFAYKMGHVLLAKKAKAFACRNYYRVTKTKNRLKNLELNNLLELLEDDDVYVQREDDACIKALDWVAVNNGTQHLKKILQHLRLTQLDAKYIRYELMTKPLIKNSPECVQLLQDVLNYHLFRECCPDVTSLYPRLPHNQEMNVLVLGQAGNMFAHSLQRPGQSQSIAHLPNENYLVEPNTQTKWYTVCTIGNNVYMFKKRGTICRLWHFNADVKKWRSCDQVVTYRTAFSVAAVQDKIYLLGGLSTTNNSSTDTIEELDITSLRLKKVGALSKAFYNMAAVAYKGDIFAFGGRVKPSNGASQTECSVQRFSTSLFGNPNYDRNFKCYVEKPVPAVVRNLNAEVYQDKAILFDNRHQRLHCFVYNLENKSCVRLHPNHSMNNFVDTFLSNGTFFIAGYQVLDGKRSYKIVSCPVKSIVDDTNEPWTVVKELKEEGEIGACAVVKLETNYVKWVPPTKAKRSISNNLH